LLPEVLVDLVTIPPVLGQDGVVVEVLAVLEL
jgi:hypothetical protein